MEISINNKNKSNTPMIPFNLVEKYYKNISRPDSLKELKPYIDDKAIKAIQEIQANRSN